MATLRVDTIAAECLNGESCVKALVGAGFRHAADVAISNIQNNVHTYYTIADGEVALIDVRDHPLSGRPVFWIITKSYASSDLSCLPAWTGPQREEPRAA